MPPQNYSSAVCSISNDGTSTDFVASRFCAQMNLLSWKAVENVGPYLSVPDINSRKRNQMGGHTPKYSTLDTLTYSILLEHQAPTKGLMMLEDVESKEDHGVRRIAGHYSDEQTRRPWLAYTSWRACLFPEYGQLLYHLNKDSDFRQFLALCDISPVVPSIVLVRGRFRQQET
ncbi:uncharacterized protein EV420DRAFT_1480911 [Desarmillaria tabescens]|uniref:Uncharacterized protein n=1 Tax=Armillaria tabescens TaxID=1929756 RepID=A0AA39KBQ1_ARMTA|nr:uncharacterized protein EV420DRAFT_1480911 [Desarmillaria tabescens]KAK0457035.1 hypothetical protein EV420DRAFT_1480911 [Desarmillaria tabescens]